ncbi:MAG: glycosyltransferase family 2 protein [Candidatus Shapirobacteria bacterium]
MKKENIDLSIIILSYNTREFLKKCLASVFKAEKNKYQIEVVVVDNASTDGSIIFLKKLLKAKRNKLKVIFSERNLGFAGGNNLGLKSAKGKYILFLNSDTEIKPQAFFKSLNFMESHPDAGALTPKTMLFSGQMDPDCHRGFPTPWASLTYFFGLEKIFPKSKTFGQYHQNYLNLNQVHEIDAGFGTFLLTRKETLKEVGGWDEEYFFYGEDLDLFYRIKKAGRKVYFLPEVLVIHHKGGSSGLRKESRKKAKVDSQTSLKAAQASIRAMEIFYRKFYQDKYPGWLNFIVLLGIKTKGFFRVLLYKAK